MFTLDRSVALFLFPVHKQMVLSQTPERPYVSQGEVWTHTLHIRSCIYFLKRSLCSFCNQIISRVI